MEKKIESIITLSLLDRFPSGYPNRSYFNYVANNVGIEGLIAVAGMLFPDFIIVDGHIFLAEHYPMVKNNLKTRFGNDRKTLERYVNLFCAADFYLLAADETSLSEKWQLHFVNILKEFWNRRLREVFPEKTFEFEISKKGLFDEDGVCLTFCQK